MMIKITQMIAIDFDGTTDVFTITSLYGYKLSDQWAVSALGEYRSSIIR